MEEPLNKGNNIQVLARIFLFAHLVTIGLTLGGTAVVQLFSFHPRIILGIFAGCGSSAMNMIALSEFCSALIKRERMKVLVLFFGKTISFVLVVGIFLNCEPYSFLVGYLTFFPEAIYTGRKGQWLSKNL